MVYQDNRTNILLANNSERYSASKMCSIESFERESHRQCSVRDIINLIKRNGKLSNLAPRCSFLIHERNGNARFEDTIQGKRLSEDSFRGKKKKKLDVYTFESLNEFVFV